MKNQEIRSLDTFKHTNTFFINKAADFPASGLGGQQAAQLAKWTVASHVERVGVKVKKSASIAAK